ncbi:hypothetical protein GYA19_01225 [Candidatus Beckwithbacteria bacterium]|nr:hypothetical protein [Candidatus Beckwithbacteria bacterium]
MITIDDITIKIRMFNHPKLIAQAQVIFFNILETKGWKIMPSNRRHPRFQEEIWIQPPGYPNGIKNGKQTYGLTVWVNDKKLYDQIEEKIYDAFCMLRNKEEGEKNIAEATYKDEVDKNDEKLEEIDIDEIPNDL